MLKSIDILIGFSVIMLVVSIAVTLCTQTFASYFNLRGRQLYEGIRRLMRYIDHGLDGKTADIITSLVLTHPVVGQPTLRGGAYQYASVIQREELTILLMRIAVGQAPELRMNDVQKEAAARLQSSIVANGVADIEGTLKAIRTGVLDLELSNPELSNSARTNRAILLNAKSEFVAKLNSWFDQTIDRVDEAFTKRTYLITIVSAMVVAGALQLDALSILNRLGIDDAYRAALVNVASRDPTLSQQITGGSVAAKIIKAAPAADQAAAPAAPAQALPRDRGRVASSEADAKKKLDALMDVVTTSDVVQIPDYSAQGWRDLWPSALPGILLSAALLSLGGPFWYEMLKNLLKLKSVLAGKDEANRKERQSTQTLGLNT